MRTLWRISALAATLLAAPHSSSFGANITFRGAGGYSNDGLQCGIKIQGEIVEGDAAKFQNTIARLDRGSSFTLCLDSIGGSYAEGLKIAKIIIDRGGSTHIENDAQCFSSCAIIFLAGSEHQESHREPSRHLHVRGKLGFHAPYFSQSDGNRLSKEDLFRTGLLAISELLKLDGRGDNIPKGLVAEMLRRGPDELFNVETMGQIREYKIQLFGTSVLAKDWPERSPELLCHACLWYRAAWHESADYVKRAFKCDPSATQAVVGDRGGIRRWRSTLIGGSNEPPFQCVVTQSGSADGTRWAVTSNAFQLKDLPELDFWPDETPVTKVAALTGWRRSWTPDPSARPPLTVEDMRKAFPALGQSGQWNHNGSTMRLIADGARRTFVYQQPRQGMRDQGVAAETVLFVGSKAGNTYAGIARVFRRGCGPQEYQVSGTVSEDRKTVTMTGRAPRIGDRCERIGYRDDTLVFVYIE